MSDTKVDQLTDNGQAPAPGLVLPAAGANGRGDAANPMPDEELGEWIDSLEYVIRSGGAERAATCSPSCSGMPGGVERRCRSPPTPPT